jgi:hypothetical protein
MATKFMESLFRPINESEGKKDILDDIEVIDSPENKKAKDELAKSVKEYRPLVDKIYQKITELGFKSEVLSSNLIKVSEKLDKKVVESLGLKHVGNTTYMVKYINENLINEDAGHIQKTLGRINRIADVTNTIEKIQAQTLRLLNKVNELSDMDSSKLARLDHEITVASMTFGEVEDALDSIANPNY